MDSMTSLLMLDLNWRIKYQPQILAITSKIIQGIISDVVKPLSFICNKSFETGVFPEKMKMAKIIPLYKAGAKNKFTNYRPVSLLPQFSKILEKLFNNRLDKFIEKNEIITDCQYGFRPKKSTNLALLDLKLKQAGRNQRLLVECNGLTALWWSLRC